MGNLTRGTRAFGSLGFDAPPQATGLIATPSILGKCFPPYGPREFEALQQAAGQAENKIRSWEGIEYEMDQ